MHDGPMVWIPHGAWPMQEQVRFSTRVNGSSANDRPTQGVNDGVHAGVGSLEAIRLEASASERGPRRAGSLLGHQVRFPPMVFSL